MKTEDLITIAQIREALGVNEKVMLSDLLETIRRIRRDAERYAKVRSLMPTEFIDLHLNSTCREEFDALIDDLVDKSK